MARFVAPKPSWRRSGSSPLGQYSQGVGLQLSHVLEGLLDAVRPGRHHTVGLCGIPKLIPR